MALQMYLCHAWKLDYINHYRQCLYYTKKTVAAILDFDSDKTWEVGIVKH